jgi:hypothetical protein
LRYAGLLALTTLAPVWATESSTSIHLQSSGVVADDTIPALEHSDALASAPAKAAQRRVDVLVAAERAISAHIAGATLRVTDAHVQPRGPSLVRYVQTFDGIDVYGARSSVLLDRNLEVRAIGGNHSAARPSSGRAAFVLDEAAALDKALAVVDENAVSLAARRVEAPAAGYSRFDLAASSRFAPSHAARVKAVWFPTNDGLMPAYYVELVGTQPGAERPLAYAVIVSAADGRELHRHSLMHDLRAFDYRVFANTQGFPYVDPFGYTNPHPTGTPDGYLPSVPAPMNLLSLSHADISTGDPWLADAATETVGNNVDAFFNADVLDEDGYCTGLGYGPAFNADEGDYRAPLSSPWSFDYAYDVGAQADDYYQCTSDPAEPIPTDSVQLRAKIVQAFYATNWLHDLFYDLGYDEASGNPQTDNYGRGGIDNDPLIVHAGFDTTFTYGPADGESPALSLGRNSLTATGRDVSAFDFGVLAHEWTHTMFGRLAGTNFYLGQEGALNEGIADFVGMFVMVRAADRNATPGPGAFNSTYAVGAYMNTGYDYRPDALPRAGSAGNPDNTYYHGIRRFPTTFDLAKNPLTFKHIGVDNPLPAEWNAYDWKARSLQNSEIHTAGEVFTAAMWECARNILGASPSSQFEATKRRILSYVVDGMKALPLDPTFVEARNALLFAVRADDESDYRRCRAGFAKRGLGAGAIAPDRHSYSLRGAVESFRNTDRALSIVDTRLVETGGDGDGVLDRGETGTLRITLTNSGLLPLTHVRVKVPALPTLYAFPGGNERLVSLQPDQSSVIEFGVKVLTRRPLQTLHFAVTAFDTQHLDASDFALADFLVNADRVRDTSVDTLQSAAAFEADWTHTFDGYPHGCAQGICSNDPDVDSSFADMLDWTRGRYHGETAYTIGDPHMAIRSALESVAFDVSTTAPLRITLRHDYDTDRQTALPSDTGADPGLATLEFSIDGGDWEYADAYLVSGSAIYSGTSEGWRNDTLDFGDHLAGRSLRLRLHLLANSSWVADDAHWAISRIAVEGAATPLFTTLHGDVN